MRNVKIMMALATVPLALGGCAALGLEDTPTTSESAPAGESWMLLAEGEATPSPTVTRGRAPTSATPAVSAPAPDPSCTRIWPRTDAVFIPIEVTPGAGSLRVEWPTQYDSGYRVTAVPQKLVSGPQPEPSWTSVAPSSGCETGATLTGLTPGAAYIVWLDAPNTGYETDGTRHLYSGRSGVVYPE